MGCYWLWLGSRLLRGMRAVTSNPRRFVGGNVVLFLGFLGVFISNILLGSGMERGESLVPGGVILIVSALWLWVAARLLKVDGAPVADLRLFVGGNILLIAAMPVSIAGLGLILVRDETVPGTAALATGVGMFLLAAKLLRALAPERQDVEDEDGAEAEESPLVDAVAKIGRYGGGVALVLCGLVVWFTGVSTLFVSAEDLLDFVFAEGFPLVAGAIYWLKAWGVTLAMMGAFWTWVGWGLLRGSFELELSDLRWFISGNLALAVGFFCFSQSLDYLLSTGPEYTRLAPGRFSSRAARCGAGSGRRSCAATRRRCRTCSCSRAATSCSSSPWSWLGVGVGLSTEAVEPVAANVCYAAGALLFVLAAALLRVTTKQPPDAPRAGLQQHA